MGGPRVRGRKKGIPTVRVLTTHNSKDVYINMKMIDGLVFGAYH